MIDQFQQIIIELIDSGSLPILKSLRTLYCNTLCKYKATPPAHSLGRSSCFPVVILNIKIDMKWLQPSFRYCNNFYFCSQIN